METLFGRPPVGFSWPLTRQLWGGVVDLCFPPCCVLCFDRLDRSDTGTLASSCRDVAVCNAVDAAAGDAVVAGGDAVAGCVRRRGLSFAPLQPGLCQECFSILRGAEIALACDRCGRQVPEFAGQPPTQTPQKTPAPREIIGLSESRVPGELAAARRVCQECQQRPPEIARMIALGAYRDALREAVIACKRMTFAPLAMALGRMLAEKLAQELETTPLDAVTFIPSHWTRRVQRGGLPTQLIADQIGNRLRVPVVSLLRARRRTAKQGMLEDAQRRQNVRDAFRAIKGYALPRRRVLVVDDVWTTGSTMREAAGVLQQHYQVEVLAAVVARAVGTHTTSR